MLPTAQKNGQDPIHSKRTKVFNLMKINSNRWKICSIFIIILSLHNTISFAQCNGYIDLCSKAYNEVAYLTSHNAYSNSEDSYYFPNQNLNIPHQLDLGVRALMLDIYEHEGDLMLYHSVSELGFTYLVDVLLQIKYFLINNPNEILTLILEDYSTTTALNNTIDNVGLNSYLYSHSEYSPFWPSLQEMIDSNQRLIIFTDNDDLNAPETLHFIWNFAVETHFDVTNIEDFDCAFNRGNEQNDLFIFNHFISNYNLYLTNSELYLNEIEQVNGSIFLTQRLSECISETGKFPNFIAIDFIDLGQPMQVVNEINQSSITHISEQKYEDYIFPNPNNGNILLKSKDPANTIQVAIFNLIGINLTSKIKINRHDSNISIDFSSFNNGTYLLKVGASTYKIVKE